MPMIEISDDTASWLRAYQRRAVVMLMDTDTDETAPASIDELAELILRQELAARDGKLPEQALPALDDRLPF